MGRVSTRDFTVCFPWYLSTHAIGVKLRSINSAIVSMFDDPISVIFIINIPVCPYVDEL